jgi:hypothetical protein
MRGRGRMKNAFLSRFMRRMSRIIVRMSIRMNIHGMRLWRLWRREWRGIDLEHLMTWGNVRGRWVRCG